MNSTCTEILCDINRKLILLDDGTLTSRQQDCIMSIVEEDIPRLKVVLQKVKSLGSKKIQKLI